jgi:hypothetical protein
MEQMHFAAIDDCFCRYSQLPGPDHSRNLHISTSLYNSRQYSIQARLRKIFRFKKLDCPTGRGYYATGPSDNSSPSCSPPFSSVAGCYVTSQQLLWSANFKDWPQYRTVVLEAAITHYVIGYRPFQPVRQLMACFPMRKLHLLLTSRSTPISNSPAFYFHQLFSNSSSLTLKTADGGTNSEMYSRLLLIDKSAVSTSHTAVVVLNASLLLSPHLRLNSQDSRWRNEC